MLAFALAVVPHGGSLITIARCWARTRPGAMRELLEGAVKRDWTGTAAEHLEVTELTARERQWDRDLARAAKRS